MLEFASKLKVLNFNPSIGILPYSWINALFSKILRLAAGSLPIPFLGCSVSKFFDTKTLLPKASQKGDYARLISPSSGYLRADAIYFCKKKPLKRWASKSSLEQTWHRRGSSCRNGTKKRGHKISTAVLLIQKLKQSFVFEADSGAARILPLIDYQLIKKKTQKPLMGYSDITAIHCCDSDSNWAWLPFMAERNWELE